MTDRENQKGETEDSPKNHTKARLIAVLLSVLFPGLGQLYRGQTRAGLVWIGSFIFLALTFFGAVIPIFYFACIIHAGVSRSGKSTA